MAETIKRLNNIRSRNIKYLNLFNCCFIGFESEFERQRLVSAGEPVQTSPDYQRQSKSNNSCLGQYAVNLSGLKAVYNKKN